ncbi:MAG TPA: aminotransferase class III-fold pyridoxal phosphate-dependent enzyme, partial [Myxococcota bacterium]|nr:aminotransferase class III-fold pyridoxal phosphate-dependent enzyme [Myxococcota bacterium]
TSTHLGNPLGCAAALAVLRTLEAESLLRRADEAGARFLARLGKQVGGSSRVRALRGRGLLVAVELDDAAFARELGGALLRTGWIALGEGPENRTLALTPPLGIAESLCEAFADRLGELVR